MPRPAFVAAFPKAKHRGSCFCDNEVGHKGLTDLAGDHRYNYLTSHRHKWRLCRENLAHCCHCVRGLFWTDWIFCRAISRISLSYFARHSSHCLVCILKVRWCMVVLGHGYTMTMSNIFLFGIMANHFTTSGTTDLLTLRALCSAWTHRLPSFHISR